VNETLPFECALRLKKSDFTPAKLVSLLELFTLGDSHEISESVHIEVLLVRVRFRVRVMARVFIFVAMLMFVNCFFFF
jgi:hypothetical protein